MEFGLKKRMVVVIQEIEPKVHFLILWSLYTFVEVTLKLLLNPELSVLPKALKTRSGKSEGFVRS